MKCISCGKPTTPELSNGGQCVKCEREEARERARVDWRSMTPKQIEDKERELARKYDAYRNG